MNVQSVEFPEVLETANVKRVTLWRPPKEFKGKTLEEKAVIANRQKRLRKQQRLRQDQNANAPQRYTVPDRLYKAKDGYLRHAVIMDEEADADGIKVQFVRCGVRESVPLDRLIPFDENLKDTKWKNDDIEAEDLSMAVEVHLDEEKKQELQQEQEQQEQEKKEQL